ncbi:signal transduction histidine kinase [Sphaerochaeta pleomorpha str. Grapes]|uniref:histidine kinase n=1 Tax=Sphaerochaeta pleomorpha (strain ATCC BAA-1885 / DSM 22778 / Grapes) TaxID=158190 RepID=G8QU85_SPHPG|nr:HAMP domain-containing sensor histidine kinase [Sphaerochaeta pleomorpha]AEV28055.1 signal transduction histidine kinase [Sphaerochaeta pleomorpha str. Grapes]
MKQRISSRLFTYMKGLSARMLVLVLLSLVMFSLVLSLLLYFGSEQILESWRISETASLHSYIEENLLAVANEARQEGAPVTTARLSEAFSSMPFSPSWIVVTGPDGQIAYYYRKGEGSGMARNFLQNVMMEGNEWYDVLLSDGSLAFRYSTVMPAFNELDSNRMMLSAARQLLLWGAFLAAVLSFVFAFFFSRPLKKQAASLVVSLNRMASGNRDVAIPDCPVLEFNQISKASIVLQENLKNEEALRRQWAADVAHDLRTPITVVRGQLEAMLDGIFAPDTNRLNRLLSENVKLEALVQSLALLTRIETPGFSPTLQSFSLPPFFSRIAEKLGPEIERAGFSLVLDIPPSSLTADQVLFERIIDNLISNAIRYGKQGEVKVSVTCSENGKPLTCSIENIGSVKDDVLSRMFDRLYRADSARETSGSGLGLSIVKAIAEAHGWTVFAESDEKSERTRFVLSFT